MVKTTKADPPCLISALRFVALGCRPLPVWWPGARIRRAGETIVSTGKEPIESAWGDPEKHERSEESLRQFWRKQPQANVGVQLGALGRIIDLDVDDPDAAEAPLRRIFRSGLPQTLGWMNAEGRFHLIFWWDELLAQIPDAIVKAIVNDSGEITKHADYLGLEVRIGAKPGESKQFQTVIPPSLLEDGTPRVWNAQKDILSCPQELIDDLLAHAIPKEQPAQRSSARRATAKRFGSPLEAFVAAALAKECTALAETREGGRNNQLNASAFNLGTLVGARVLTRETVERELTRAAEQCKLPSGTIGPTLKSGLDAGIAKPRDLTEVGRKSEHTGDNGKASDNGETDESGAISPARSETDSASRRFNLTDLGNGERLKHRHGDKLRYVHPFQKYLVWDGMRWDLDNTAKARKLAKDAARAIYKEAFHGRDDAERKAIAKWAHSSEANAKIKAMLECAAAEEGIALKTDQLNSHLWLLNVQNGTVELETGKLRPHRREDYLTQVCPVLFLENAECPHYDDTLAKVFMGSQKLIAYWQRTCGYFITGVIYDQRIPILHGTGANGKSTVVGAMLDTLGADYAMKAPHGFLAVKRQESHPTELADLFGKRFVAAIETGEGMRINEVLVKELTGGDAIRARRMREDFWEFKPTHKVMLATNHEPDVRGTDHAIWRRILKVPFNAKIEPADLTMPQKLQGERAGILAWAIRGCLAWQQIGLDPPEAVRTATDAYRKGQDRVADFIAEHCNTGIEQIRVKAGTLYARYKRWAEQSGEDALNLTRFGKTITERGYRKETSNGIWYLGIGLRQESDDNN